MAYYRCHQYNPGPNTRENVAHACGTCGGDKRMPTAEAMRDDERRQADHIAGEAHSGLAARGIL